MCARIVDTINLEEGGAMDPKVIFNGLEAVLILLGILFIIGLVLSCIGCINSNEEEEGKGGPDTVS